MTARNLAAMLRQQGIEVIGSDERTYDADASVLLPSNKDVQITGKSFTLNQWVEDDESFWELGTFRGVSSLVNAIRNA